MWINSLGDRPALLIGSLRGHPLTRTIRRQTTLLEPLEPGGFACLDHHDDVELAPSPCLDEQRDVVHDHRAVRHTRHQFLRTLRDERMNDPIQVGARRLVRENQLRELGPVELAVRADDVAPESGHHGCEPGRARANDLPGDLVGIDDHGTVLGEQRRDRALARSHAAGQPDSHSR